MNSGPALAFEKRKALAESRWKELFQQPRILVGTATCGRAAGGLEVLKTIREELKKAGQSIPVMEVGCMGHCYAEPLVVISKPDSDYAPIVYGYVTPEIARLLVRDSILGDDPSLEFMLGALEANEALPSLTDLPRFRYEKPVLLENCGRIDPEDVDQYIANGGYAGLDKALEMKPQDVIELVRKAGLKGRGGAGFSTVVKWETCRNSAETPKYLICNGDEGDPGAFMDRAILESDPHSVIEGMIIAAYAIGAGLGYIYVRAEYPLAVERVRHALRQAEDSNLLGKNILGSGFSFTIRLFEGSGAFVCGEETALIASIEGKPGLPRHRPPFPATKGLFGKPTIINNVKTLASVSRIVSRGLGWYSSLGINDHSSGTAVFALAGKVVNTGLTEVPMGTSLRQVIFEVGGGIPKGKKFKAVQIGGPSGGCLPESTLDLPIDFDSLTEAGAMMGSGGMVVLDEDDCMVDVARFFLEFTQNESCGKCTLCRLGTRQMLEILQSIAQGKAMAGDLKVLAELARDVKAASLCNLGKTAPNPILTTLRYFEEEYEAHIKEGRCPARRCPDLMAYYIIPEKCERSCDACVGTCTVEAIYVGQKRVKVIDQAKCVKCGTCVPACPPQYNAIVKISPLSELPEALPALKAKG
ncbi:MAG: NADH-ubiquinone oxidoreductase-F iron-sulfur binding region domain-containing protein [Dehalococcoidia bacterium]|nr:NADH-ubiquinone oxidoreductase-F iron-sulfur binding region domain-containing protein [Dehalococcoidia bacterium]